LRVLAAALGKENPYKIHKETLKKGKMGKRVRACVELSNLVRRRAGESKEDCYR